MEHDSIHLMRISVLFILTLTSLACLPQDTHAFGPFGLHQNTIYRGARWDAAPRRNNQGLERSLDGGIRFSLDGGSYESFRDKFNWRTTPTVEDFREAVEQSFAAWTVTDRATRLPGMLSFTEDFSTPVEKGNRVGSEIDIIARQFDSSGQRGFTTLSWGNHTNMTLTSGVSYVGQPIAGSDIEMNSHPDTQYSLEWFQLILTHEIGHSLGLRDVDVGAGPAGEFIDDNYDASTSTSARQTLTNSFADLVDPLNPGRSPLRQYLVANGSPGFDSSGTHLLMETNIPSSLLRNPRPLTNDEYAGRQFLYPAPPMPHSAPMTVLSADSPWRFWDRGTDPGSQWTSPTFVDDPATTDWGEGRGHFGYGDGDEDVVIECGPSASCSSRNFATQFFRGTFDVADPTLFTGLVAELVRDDAAAVYVNGTEIFRDDNLRSNADFETFATDNGFENGSVAFHISPDALIVGANVIAVEVHQDSTTSSDVSFEFSLRALGATGDFDGDLILTAADIDALGAATSEAYDLRFDLNRDQLVNADDHQLWVQKISGTYFGDADLDGEFNSADLVIVFAAGKYETAERSGWAEGDWNGDFRFESGDLVSAFADGGYELGPRMARPIAIPEPSSFLLTLLATLSFIAIRRSIYL